VYDLLSLGVPQVQSVPYETRDIDELKNIVKEEITATPDNMVREAMRTLRNRMEQCTWDGGKHLRDALFKKWNM